MFKQNLNYLVVIILYSLILSWLTHLSHELIIPQIGHSLIAFSNKTYNQSVTSQNTYASKVTITSQYPTQEWSMKQTFMSH